MNKINDFDTSILLDNSPQATDDYQNEADILKSKISEAGVKNIAVVASFGAGKSSAIETYLLKNRDKNKKKYIGKKPSEIIKNINSLSSINQNKKKLLHQSDGTYTKVSLASFNDTEYKDGDIERSILQQMLRSAKKSQLPNSTIERTTNNKWYLSLLIASIVSVFLASCTILGLSFLILYVPHMFILQIAMGGIAFTTFTILFYFLIHYKKFSKIKYKDFEVEIKNNEQGAFSTSGQSLINKFVDEVLYFFQCTKIDLVIFEDLDRLADKASSSIFVKLRELNTIINNSQLVKKITFLYAVKDDMIKSQEQRSKFFEFILPIIPIINPQTITNKILELQGNIVSKKPELELESEFIHSISGIKGFNMRIIKNVYNDYIVAHDRIFVDSVNGRLQNEKLFALCMYKNLYPAYYADLESRNEGLIPIVVDKKHLYKNAVDKASENIIKLENDIKKADECFNQSFEELKLMFAGQALECPVKQIYKGHNNEKTIEIKNIETFKNLDCKNVCHPQRNADYNYNYVINIDKEPSLPSGETYYQREQIIKSKSKMQKDKILKQIAQERDKISKYESMKFCELVVEFGIDICFDSIVQGKLQTYANGKIDSTKNQTLKKILIKKVDLETDSEYKTHINFLRFLVENDYIDENYIEYTSSYQSFLSSSDDGFRQKVLRGEQDWNYQINNIENLLTILRAENFTKTAILNNSLLCSIEKIYNKNKKAYENLQKMLNSDKEQVYKAIVDFVSYNNNEIVKNFYKNIATNICISVFNVVIKNNTIIDEKKDVVLQLMIDLYNNVYIPEEYDCSDIVGYVEKHKDYINLFGSLEFAKLEKFLFKFAPCVDALFDKNNDITKFLIKNHLYKISVDNLKTIFDVDDSELDFYNKNYEYISKDSTVKSYIDSNLIVYIEKVFLSDHIENQDESIDIIKKFFLDKQLDSTHKKGIIAKYAFIINDIIKCDKDLYMALFKYSRVCVTWQNLIQGYNNGVNFENGLKEWLVSNVDDLDVYNCDKNTAEQYNKIIMDAINKKWNNNDVDIFKKFLHKFDNVCNQLSEKFINDENLVICIKENKITYNQDDLKFLLDKPRSLVAYINKHYNDTIRDFDKFFVSIDEQNIRILLFVGDISKDIKQKLVISHFGKITNVNGFEKNYYNAITSNKLDITTTLLLKFKDSQLSKEQKLRLLRFTSDKDIPQNKANINAYLESTEPDFKDVKRDVKFIDVDVIVQLKQFISQITGRECKTSRKDGVVIFKKINNK